MRTSTRKHVGTLATVGWLAACAWTLTWTPTFVVAAQPPDPDQIPVEALQCWRDVRSSAVRVGEPFTMTVTCGVIETATATTVPNEVGLAPETIDLSPFEVIEGRRFADVRDGPWRFFQYHYTLRVIDEDAFGEDLEIPELEIQYHIERSLDGGSALPGRELTYVLPAEAIRVLSLVPADASDIRGLQSETFGDADTRLFRANLAVLVATAVGAVAFGVLLMAAIRARQHWWGAAPKGEKRLSSSVVVRRVLAELHAVQRTSQEEGWNAGLVGRALTAFRLAGAAALDTPIAQEQVEPRRADREGQLAVNHGLVRIRTTALSSAVTTDALTGEIARRHADRPHDSTLGLLEDLQGALRVFTNARYSPNGHVPTDQMTGELDKGIGAVRQLRFWILSPVQKTTRLVSSARDWWTHQWNR